MSAFEEKIFDEKSLADIFSDIYHNTDTKRTQIESFIKKLVVLIKTPEDAIMLAPIIKDFMDANIKNDEHVVRVAQIVQRIVSVGTKAGGEMSLLTDAEKEQLLTEVAINIEDIKRQTDELDDELVSMSSKNDEL